MQLERVKTVGKKKVVAIATTLMLTVGGVSAFASETGQNYMKANVDKFFAYAVDYYVKNVSTDLEQYATDKKNGGLYASLSGMALGFTNDIKAHYDNELKRAKAELDKSTTASIQANSDYAGAKNNETKQTITNEVNRALEQKKYEMNDFIENTIGDSFANTSPIQPK